MEDLSARIERIREAEQLTQAELARRAGISQSSVSRMVHEPRLRMGRAYAKLESMIRQYEVRMTPPKALAALRRTWDRSPDHDQALEKLILASQAFRPKM